MSNRCLIGIGACRRSLLERAENKNADPKNGVGVQRSEADYCFLRSRQNPRAAMPRSAAVPGSGTRPFGSPFAARSFTWS